MRALIVLLISLIPLLATAASNTIYKCKNADGKFVYQQQVCDESNLVSNNSTSYELWTKMKAMSQEGKHILSQLGPDLESIKKCNKTMLTFKNSLGGLNEDVRSVANKNPKLFKAYTYLNDCAVCRSSAESNCLMADKFLDEAVSKLTQY